MSQSELEDALNKILELLDGINKRLDEALRPPQVPALFKPKEK